MRAQVGLKSMAVLKTIESVRHLSVRQVKEAFEKIDSRIRIHHHGIALFEPHIRLNYQRGHYLIKTAENGAELEQCLKLRFEVFHREFMSKKRTFGVDVDKLDFLCDHLIIIDTRTSRTIGTYRLNCSKFNSTFYSAGEFQIDRILQEPGHKLEMGRACIDKEHRNGAVMGLLWRGIVEYAQQTESRYLFGCGSVKTTDQFESALIYRWLRDRGHMDQDFAVVPTRKFRMPGFAQCVQYVEACASRFSDESVREMIPSLFHSYLKAGAVICGEPALDREFSCIDFLVLLNMDEMNPLFARKYKG